MPGYVNHDSLEWQRTKRQIHPESTFHEDIHVLDPIIMSK